MPDNVEEQAVDGQVKWLDRRTWVRIVAVMRAVQSTTQILDADQRKRKVGIWVRGLNVDAPGGDWHRSAHVLTPIHGVVQVDVNLASRRAFLTLGQRQSAPSCRPVRESHEQAHDERERSDSDRLRSSAM